MTIHRPSIASHTAAAAAEICRGTRTPTTQKFGTKIGTDSLDMSKHAGYM